MGALYIVVPYYRTFRGDAVQPGPHVPYRTEQDALSVARQPLRTRGQALGCHVLVAPANLAGGMTDTPRILHRFGWCPDTSPARAAG